MSVWIYPYSALPFYTTFNISLREDQSGKWALETPYHTRFATGPQDTTDLINQLFNVGVFAGQLKISKVLSLFKKGNASNFSNYRLIALPLCLSALVLFQSLIYIRLHNIVYFSQNCDFGGQTLNPENVECTENPSN